MADLNLPCPDCGRIGVCVCDDKTVEVRALRATIAEQAATIARLEGELAAQQRTLSHVYRVLTVDAPDVAATYIQAAEWLRNRAAQAEAERDALRATIAEQAATIARLEGERAELLSVVATAHTAGLRFGMGPCVCKWCACAAALEADRG